MKRSIDYDTLNDYFELPHEFLFVHIQCLKTVASEDDFQSTINKVINALYRTGCTTIGDIMELKWDDLGKVRNFGVGCEDLLFELLDRICKDPTGFIDKNKAEIVKIRMRESGYIK